MKFVPHDYQLHAIEHAVDQPFAGLFLDMGLGKSISTATAVQRLMYDQFEIAKPLIVAPKRVVESTWPGEFAKWDHLKDMRLSLITGTAKQRLDATKASADIWAVSRDNISWLVTQLGDRWPFDCLIIDESSSFKNHKSQRFKALKLIRPLVKRVIILTGTPAPNSLIDLWPQIYLLDQGHRLGKTITQFRESYFTPGKHDGYVVYDYKLRKDTETKIYDRIKDVCISMKAEDYLSLPKRIDNDIQVVIPEDVRRQYNQFEEEEVMRLVESEEPITAANAAALTNKLLQFAAGAVYDKDGKYHVIHDHKIDYLEEVIEAANGHPVLCFYWFKSDLERLLKRFKHGKQLQKASDVDAWNAKKIELLFAHPGSAGHGLNMQDGGHHISWFNNTWSLELYQQAVARLDRQGQKFPVINSRLYVPGTVEVDVLKALDRKEKGQSALMAAVKAKIKQYANIQEDINRSR